VCKSRLCRRGIDQDSCLFRAPEFWFRYTRAVSVHTAASKEVFKMVKLLSFLCTYVGWQSRPGGFNITPDVDAAQPSSTPSSARRREGICRGCYLAIGARGRIWRQRAARGIKVDRCVSVNRFCSSGCRPLPWPQPIRSMRRLHRGRALKASRSPAGLAQESIDLICSGFGPTSSCDDRHRRYRRRALQAQPRIIRRVLAGIAAPHGGRQQANKSRTENRPDETKMRWSTSDQAESIVDYTVDRDE